MARVSRRDRELELVRAVRRLFDARGAHDVPIDEVAREAGINKAVIYRHFASKDELYVQALVEYLSELAGRLEEPVPEPAPEARLEAAVRRFVRFGVEHPAFAASALQLMRSPVADLRERVSQAVLLRLGEAMARCLAVLAGVLRAGAASGAFGAGDHDLAANMIYARCLGLLHLGRLGTGVRIGAQGMPELFPITAADIEREAVADALATAWRENRLQEVP